jgi:hypothetical protein
MWPTNLVPLRAESRICYEAQLVKTLLVRRLREISPHVVKDDGGSRSKKSAEATVGGGWAGKVKAADEGPKEREGEFA